MIRFVRVEQNKEGLVHFVIKIDAAAAKILDRDKKVYVESEVDIRIIKLAYEIRKNIYGTSESDLRKFLRDELFTHYFDIKVINLFIENIKNQSIKYAEDIEEIGLDIIYTYKNHPWKQEDEDNQMRWDEWDKKHRKK